MTDEPRWLDDTERSAWLSLLAVVLVGFPELERTFRPHGLVHVEFGLLAALSNACEGLRLSELAAQMNMSPSRLSHRMRKLVDLGYVELTGDACDGRVSIAQVTAAGRAFAERVAPAHLADVRRLIFDNLDPAQTAALADALGAIAEKLGESCPGSAVAPKGPPVPGARAM
ncbi:MarR family winged helix-turn-helix transcriptional regulator [Dactylosporangium sp. CA-092794]|uniref:MarR family winged helix-turn-helix transcriptional regulator n=1 Tax=Dactylosporangium sp. CA-092794 TaxID=3239929 RepID=UPI003D8AC7AB